MDLGGALEPPDGLSGLSDDAVGFVFDQYAGVMAAAHAHLLAVICEVGARERMVSDDGARTVGAWVAARAGVRRATEEAWAGAAGRLAGLPVMWSVMAEGELSFEQVGPASVLATAETDAVVTERARVEGAAALARWGPRSGPRRRGCGGCWCAATGGARSRGARRNGTSTPTTSCTGPMAAPRSSRT